VIDVGKIDRIEHLRDEEVRIRKEQNSIKGDVEYGLEKLKVIYAVTRAKAAEFNFTESKVREYFLFVSLYVFDPTSIVRKMRKGLRQDLAMVLGVSENNISHLTKHILFRYRHYRSFREDCDKIHTQSLEIIQKYERETNPEETGACPP
jgi:hypothetical protein